MHDRVILINHHLRTRGCCSNGMVSRSCDRRLIDLHDRDRSKLLLYRHHMTSWSATLFASLGFLMGVMAINPYPEPSGWRWLGGQPYANLPPVKSWPQGRMSLRVSFIMNQKNVALALLGFDSGCAFDQSTKDLYVFGTSPITTVFICQMNLVWAGGGQLAREGRESYYYTYYLLTSEMWRFNSRVYSWTQVFPRRDAPWPPARASMTMVLDVNQNRLLVFGECLHLSALGIGLAVSQIPPVPCWTSADD